MNHRQESSLAELKVETKPVTPQSMGSAVAPRAGASEPQRASAREQEPVQAVAPAPAPVSIREPVREPKREPAHEPVMVPCATSNLQDDEVWNAVLAALEGKTSLQTLAGRLRLVSLSRLRAVLGYAPEDKLAAEMAIDKLPPIFEQVLGRPIRVVTQEIKGLPERQALAMQSAEANAQSGANQSSSERDSERSLRDDPQSEAQRGFSPDAALADELVQQARQALGPETRVVRVTPRAE